MGVPVRGGFPHFMRKIDLTPAGILITFCNWGNTGEENIWGCLPNYHTGFGGGAHTLGLAYYEFGYYKHPAITSRFFSLK